MTNDVSAPPLNKKKARNQLFVLLGFEAVLSAAAIWVGFATQNWTPVIAVLVCAGMITAMMIYALKNAKE